MRKTLLITIDAEGRDFGKVFKLTEMSAVRAEKWAARAFLAMARSGIDIPDNIAEAGLAGIAAIGFRALGGMRFDDAEPLLDEMFATVELIPDPSRPNVARPLIESDIEEVATRLRLRKEVFSLHVDFSRAVGLLTSTSAATAGDSPAT